MKVEAARPIEASKHRWYTYAGKKPIHIVAKKGGASLTLKKGDLFGVQNINNRTDRVVSQARPDLRFLLPVETSGELMERSKRHREAVEFAVIQRKPKPAAKKPVAKTKLVDAKLERLRAIKDAATNKGVKETKPAPPKKITIPAAKKRESFDLDEDTFTEDHASIDFHDFF